MSIIDVVKKLLGLAGADSATQAAVGGIMQSVSASRQAAENEDMLDAYSAQQYTSKIAWQVADLNLEYVQEALLKQDYDYAVYNMEGLEESCRDFIQEMREEEPDEDVGGDMTLVQAAKAHAEAFAKLLPSLRKIIELYRASNGEKTPEIEAAQEAFNRENTALTDEWNNALNAFMAKHNIPAESVMEGMANRD